MKNNFLITGVILLMLISATGCTDDFIIRGNVFFRGNPQIESVVSGSGSVIHKN